MDLVGLLTVTAVQHLTPHMLRVTFTAPPDLKTWPDQQLKLCFPREGQQAPTLPPSTGDDMRWYHEFMAIPEPERPWMRSFTLRAHDPERAELAIDFVLHGETGPATRWAATAAPGQVLGRYGPSAAYHRPLPVAPTYLFAGDETALPAIGSLLESLPPKARATAVIEVRAQPEEQLLPSPAEVTIHWLHRDTGAHLLPAVSTLDIPPTTTAWLAGEAGTVRELRRHLVSRGIPKPHIEFAGYWRRSLTQDDAPTEADLAEARERLAQNT